MKVKTTTLVLALIVSALTAQSLSSNPVTGFNSAYDELNPVLSPDGKTLYFTIANHPLNVGGRKDPGDIWYSTLNNNKEWSQPVHAGALVNSAGFNGIAGFSADGGEMFLLTHYDPSGASARTQGISVSRRQSNGWSRPENIHIPYFQNKSSIISGYITPDGSFFVFSAEAYGTYGVEDLYFCERKSDGRWSEPKNLGPMINTQFQEVSPSLSRDGKTLFFSTNGRKGKGSFDIYSATRLDDTWTNWSEPQNLGSANTEGRDLYYREFPFAGFSLFTSTKNSDGYGDIKVHTPETPFKQDPADSVSPGPIVIREVQPIEADNAVRIYGKVTNARTGENVLAAISFEPVEGSGDPAIVRSNSDGYTLKVDASNQYRIRIEAAGFISALEKLDINTFEMRDLEMNFRLQPIEVGTTVNLKDVLFEQSKTALLPESYAELDLVVSFLKSNPSVRIELSGHTDNRGIPAQNVKLSQGRVDKVREYLISKGVDARRITGKGYGGAKPIASNDNEDSRRLNRRVEFTIKKN